MPTKRLGIGFKLILGAMLYPSRVVTPRALSPAVTALMALGLLAPAILAEPHLKNWLYCHNHLTKPDAEEIEFAKNLCDFFAICLQIGIAIVIGGIAVTERFVRAIQAQITVMQAQGMRQLDRTQKQILRNMIQAYLDTRYFGDGLTIGNVVPKAIRIVRDMWRANGRFIQGDIYWHYVAMILLRSAAAFPGGLYGVVAFALFDGFIWIQVCKTYFDYVPRVCT